MPRVSRALSLLAVAFAAGAWLSQAAPAGAQDRLHVNPARLHDASQFYTQVILVPNAGRTAFIAGQVGVDEKGQITSPDMAGQIAQAMRNLRAAVESVSGKPEHIVKITALFVGYTRDHLTPFAQELNKLFPPGKLPTSTVIGVEKLARDGLLFEIEAIAVIP